MPEIQTRPRGANGSGLPLSEDLMTGAEAIAEFMFGTASEANRRRVYQLSDATSPFPNFRMQRP